MTMLEAVRSRLGWIAIVIVAAALGAARDRYAAGMRALEAAR